MTSANPKGAQVSLASADSLVETLAQLVEIASENPPGFTAAICSLIAQRLEPFGYRLSILSEEPACDNLVATLGEGPPHLMFTVHVDTVGVTDRAAWGSEPLVLSQRAGRLYGLGVSNAKACAAVHIALAEALAAAGGPPRGTVSFTFVTDDENVGPRGASYLRRQGLRPDYLVVGAPTRNALVLEERGVMWVAVETYGLAAHAGAPDAGDNAIERMGRMIAHLQTDLFPAIRARGDARLRSTVNLGRISGGSNTNVVPDRCRIEIDRRLLASETVEGAYAEIVASLARAGEPTGRWSSELMRGTNAFRSAPDGKLASAAAAAIEIATGEPARYLTALGAGDGRYFAGDSVQIICMGPGDGAESHCPDEFVRLGEFQQSLAIHWRFLNAMFDP
jgi:acetylornithine deacetylase/succinyl-diaminopimelate desuccinylase-like protein